MFDGLGVVRTLTVRVSAEASSGGPMSETNAASRALQGRVEFLDCLRGLAATWVVIVHVAHIPGPALHVPKWLELFVNSGPMGVELFFAVSAFSLYLAMPSHSSDQYPIATFAIRRFFRIAPLFYALLLIMIPWNPSGARTGIIDIALNVLFLFNFVHGNQPSIVPIGWTIGVEMPFYVLFPLIYILANDLKKAVLVLFLTIVIYGIEYTMVSSYLQDWQDYQLYSIFRRLPVFACGGVAYFVVKDMPSSWKTNTNAALCVAIAAIIFFRRGATKGGIFGCIYMAWSHVCVSYSGARVLPV